ncbi:MAG: MMPL family transporter [Actinobacteria bacterium]|nr:MMPL family transporter [Actinomycetota bacterium]MBU1942107.1 MMPL family transporter [Actinomycetota bacterium]MBU2686709.1 MMPL family transporter [Actinomycetota bacterium]
MRVFGWIAKMVKEHPYAVIAVCLVFTVAMGLGLLFLEGQVTYESLLPEEFPSIKALDQLRKQFGGIAYEYVLIKTPSATDNDFVEFLLGLDEEFQTDPRFSKGQIQTIEGPGGTTVPVIQSYLSPFIANIKSEMAKGGFNVPLGTITAEMVKQFTGKDWQGLVEQDYLSNPEVRKAMYGRFLTPDQKVTLIMMKVGSDLSQKEQVKLGQDLEEFFRQKLKGIPGTTFEIAGDPTLARDFDNHIRNKTLLLFGAALMLVVLTLFLAFRRFTDTMLPIVVMVLGLVWTFGFMGWVGIPYSVASIAVMPLLLGTALTFVVPLVARYYEEMVFHFRSVKAVGLAVTTVGVGIFLAAITNVFGFLVFEFSVLPPLRDFGLTCGLGTVFIFALTITMLPAIMAVRDRVYERSPEDMGKLKTHFDGLSRRKSRGLFTRAIDRGLKGAGDLAIQHSTAVIIVFSVLILFGFAQIRGLTTDSDLRKLVPRSLPGIKADFDIEQYFGGQQQDVILVKGDVLSPEALQAMAELEKGILEDPDNFYGEEQLYKEGGLTGLPDTLAGANGGRLPATKEEAQAVVQMIQDNNGFIVGGLLSEDGKEALITLNARGAQSTDVVNRKMRILQENSRKYLGPAGLTFQLGGITPLTKDMTRNIIPTETVSSVLSLVLCALVLVVIFRSIPYGLITLTVALAGVAAEIGFMGLMSWPLDVVTSLASALVIGVGVNFGILFTHRYMQEMRPGDRLASEALDTTMINLGRANVVAAIATVAGFLIIMMSGIVPLRRFGGVTAFAIGWCLITSLTLMPALLFRLSKHQRAAVERQPIEPETAQAG